MEFSLEVFTNNTGIIEVKNYVELYDSIKNALDEESVCILNDDEERKAAYKRRTELNKVKDLIDRRRITTTEEVLGTLNEQLKDLAKLFDSKAKEYTEEINNYDAKTKVVAPKKTTVTLKFLENEKIIEELKEFAVKNNCELTIK